MFASSITLNQFNIAIFEKVVADVPSERLTEKAPGNGHPPLWILGHLAICAELGEKMLGGRLTHVRWLPVFGPGSSDDVQNADQYSREDLIDVIKSAYPRLCEAAANADSATLNTPHGLELLAETPIQTIGDLVSHLLTTHFAFHLAQLSGWRRAAGHSALF